ncbi:MAG: NAD(P)H-hydrate dehydratase, partial [Acidimicrobiales bacterium]
NNGNDGRDAAARLTRRGVRVTLIGAADAPATLPASDLVIDAAFGTGFRGEYDAPDPRGAPVLAVDIPSGVDGLTGAAGGGAVRATATVTFAALKPGLLVPPGRALAGHVRLADIGLDVAAATAHLVEAADVAAWLPHRAVDAHKWQAAVWIVAGSPGMTGAAALASRGAQRGGAGYVRLSTPGGLATAAEEVVRTALPATGWAGEVIVGAGRFRALAIGPGLGRDHDQDVRRLVAEVPIVPVVVDGDGLTALGRDVARFTADRAVPAVLTPHDGEYERLADRPVGADRLSAARALARDAQAVVLLKGPTTVVAGPDGHALLVTEGDVRLATAGSGDVLTGIIAALLAGGLDPWRAAAAAAWLHGRSASLGFARGLVAGDVAEHLPEVFEQLERPEREA